MIIFCEFCILFNSQFHGILNFNFLVSLNKRFSFRISQIISRQSASKRASPLIYFFPATTFPLFDNMLLFFIFLIKYIIQLSLVRVHLILNIWVIWFEFTQLFGGIGLVGGVQVQFVLLFGLIFQAFDLMFRIIDILLGNILYQRHGSVARPVQLLIITTNILNRICHTVF